MLSIHPGTGLGSWPRRRARLSPDRLALRQDARRLTYGQLALRVEQLAAGLGALRVRRGDRVAYLGVNSIAVFETMFATQLLGAVFVPLNTRLSGTEIRYMLQDCGATVLVHSSDTDELIRGCAPLPGGVRHVIALEPQTCPAGGLDYESQFLSEERPPAAVDLDDPGVLLYTSGTTGRPKAAVLTHGNLTWNMVNQLAHTDVLSTDRALCISPLFHCVGLSQITLPTLFKGGSVEPVPRFDPAAVLNLIGDRQATSFSAVPTMLKLMCEHPSWPTARLDSLTCVIYGGSPVEERTAAAWMDRGVLLLQGYGMTEASPGVLMAVPAGAAEHRVSVGVPHFFTDVAALDVDGAALDADHDGDRVVPVSAAPRELVVRGPNVFPGYWERPAETRDSFAGGDWFRTGDVVRTEDDGWSYVVDRMKDLIISGGENIYPAEVEARMVELDAVASCAVVATPDPRWGEVGVAFVVRREGGDLDEATLRTHLEQHLARYKVPRRIEFVDALPRNATGKVLRGTLREQAATVRQ